MTFLLVLNKHAPIESKILRANHAPYMCRTVHKTIMRSSSLEINISKREVMIFLRYINIQKLLQQIV